MSKLTTLAEYVPTQEAKQPPIKQEEHHKDVEHSTLCGCTKTTSKTECTITIE